MHYTGAKSEAADLRKNFRIYKLDDYTEKIASQHTLNSSQENQLSKESLQQTTEAVIDAEFLN